MDLFRTDLAACFPWDITSCVQGIVKFIQICISHWIQHAEMVWADLSSFLFGFLLRLSLLQQNHTMHIFSSDCTVWVGFFALSAVRCCFTDYVVLLDTSYYVLQPLKTTLKNSINSTDWQEKTSASANKASVCVWVYASVCLFVHALYACVPECLPACVFAGHNCSPQWKSVSF